jgi:hypothetical protein
MVRQLSRALEVTVTTFADGMMLAAAVSLMTIPAASIIFMV